MEPRVTGLKHNKIVLVNFSDVGGGAERITWELFQGLLSRGLEVGLLLGLSRHAPQPNIQEIPLSRGPLGRIFEGLWRGLHRSSVFNGSLAPIGRFVKAMAAPSAVPQWLMGRDVLSWPGSHLVRSLVERPALFHFHNLHGGYLDLEALPRLTSGSKAVVTLHDEWLYTGHCAHSMGCGKWRHGCGGCPDLRRYPAIRKDATRENLIRKLRALKAWRPFIVTLCQWSRRRWEEAYAGWDKIRVIPNGVDTGVFHPRGREEAKRKVLGENAGAPVLLFVSALGRSYKGEELTEDSMRAIGEGAPATPIEVIQLGSQPKRTIQMRGMRLTRLPWIEDRGELADVYRAADVFLHIALADTFPLSVLEAMACGAAVVAPSLGGIPEQVSDGETGLLYDPSRPKGMIEASRALLADSSLLSSMGRSGAQRAREKFSLQRMISEYISLYEELLLMDARGVSNCYKEVIAHGCTPD